MIAKVFFPGRPLPIPPPFYLIFKHFVVLAKCASYMCISYRLTVLGMGMDLQQHINNNIWNLEPKFAVYLFFFLMALKYDYILGICFQFYYKRNKTGWNVSGSPMLMVAEAPANGR